MDTDPSSSLRQRRRRRLGSPMLENQNTIVATHDGAPLYVELPASVVLEITYTEPGP